MLRVRLVIRSTFIAGFPGEMLVIFGAWQANPWVALLGVFALSYVLLGALAYRSLMEES